MEPQMAAHTAALPTLEREMLIPIRQHRHALQTPPSNGVPPRIFVCSMAPTHRFTMSKFSDLYTYLLANNLIMDPSDVYTPQIPDESILRLAHNPEYIHAFINGTLSPTVMRKIGFEWSPALVRRTLLEIGGTMMAAELSLTHGIALNLGGGTHHADYASGSGFTILNDLAICALYMLNKYKHKDRYANKDKHQDQDHGHGHGALGRKGRRSKIDRIVIFDLDVHQGDGTARILHQHEDIYTVSIHCEQNWPMTKSQSHLDIGVEAGTKDSEYLKVVSDALDRVLDEFDPQLVIYDAGVDVSEHDKLGKLCISDDGMWRRDEMVIEGCARRGVSVCCVIGGGYDHDARRLAERHGIVFRAGVGVWDRMRNASTG